MRRKKRFEAEKEGEERRGGQHDNTGRHAI
jgi:hypothetical protein